MGKVFHRKPSKLAGLCMNASEELADILKQTAQLNSFTKAQLRKPKWLVNASTSTHQIYAQALDEQEGGIRMAFHQCKPQSVLSG